MPSATAKDSRFPFWTWAAVPVLVAAWLRLRGIGEPEPFADEGALILTALDSQVRAVIDPLAQGRPALAWLFSPAGWFPAHALEVARLMSAGAGLATLAALGWILHQVGGRAAALCGLWLWAVMPFAVLHERLALQDPFVASLLAWAVALVVAGSQSAGKQSGWWFFAAGGMFGTACLLKISAVLALPWLGLFYAAVRIQLGRPVFSRQLGFIALGALTPLLCLGRGLALLGHQSAHVESLPDFFAGNYFETALKRLDRWCGWYAGYGGWPLGLLWIGALVRAGRARLRPALGAALGSMLSVLVAALFYNRPFARYVMPDHLPLILFLALAWGSALAVAGRWRPLLLALLAVALARWGFVSRQIGLDPRHAAVPADEIEQYFTGPWSGSGLNEVRHYLTEYADRHRANYLVLTHRFFRPGYYGLLLAGLGDPRLGVVPVTIYSPEELALVRPGLRHVAAGQNVAFFILYEGSLYPPHPWLDAAGSPARRVLEVPHGARDKFTLYQFDP